MEVQNFRSSSWNFSFTDLLENYGWHLLVVAAIAVYLYRKAQPSIDKYLEKKANKEYAAKYHKNPDLAAVRFAAQQAAAQKLQDEYKQDAENYEKKMQEREAKKREEYLNKTSHFGNRLGSASTSKEQSSLRSDYNPLMGDNSRSYRPQRKSPCSGGGCGKK